jgi:hypothetical protein
MLPKYENLFSVYFKHGYYPSGNLEQIMIKPTSETSLIFLNYELVIKLFQGGFSVYYPTQFANELNTRNKILKDALDLNFTLFCNDQNVLSYTDNLPSIIENKMFLFTYSNELSNGNKLHADEYVSEYDFVDYRSINTPYFSKPFGHLHITTDEQLPTDNFIVFKAPDVHWRYIIRSNYLLECESLMITNKSRTIIFDGPYSILLPNGVAALSFVSPNKIPQTEMSGLQFQLMEEYDKQTNDGRVIIPNLPQPMHNVISFLGTDNILPGNPRVLDIML